ncbi:MAG: cellulose biosynthesis cyclic di-GMP-binding regulatory protein BcsB, partial [Myxococcota bacterium]|nr:cellulose biosynthesis cyclic di-GMP-binding regulatory protein BcsB [Myxococcota bacterium]
LLWSAGPAAAQDADDANAPVAVAEAGPGEASGVAPDETPLVGTSVVREVTFGGDLGQPRDRMLQGITAVENIYFPTPSAWELTEDPLLQFRFDHSGSLVPDRSGMTVSVNGGAIVSVPLDEQNVTAGLVEARIPRHLLEDYNTMRVEVVQHVGDECEDPFDPALWTRVRQDSSIVWRYEREIANVDLGMFPKPFFEARAYDPMELVLAGSGALSGAQLEALGVLGFAFGRHADYRKVRVLPPVSDLADADAHVLVVGTPSENPLVRQFVSRDPAAGEGLVALARHPQEPGLGVLVVTGGDAAGLLKAARAVAGEDRAEVLSGAESAVQSLDDAYPVETRQDPLPAPSEDRFDLAALGIGDTTVRGYYAPPVSIPLRLEGDAKVQIEGARIGVDYAYSAQLDNRLSTMEVRLNGVTLRSVALDDDEGEEKRRLWVDLPFELMEPKNDVEVIFHLFPRDFSPCIYTTDAHIWATVFDSTQLEVARDHYTDMPDVGLLRYDLFPYGKALGDAGVLVVTADRPDAADGSGVMQIAAELGRRSTAKRPRLQVAAGRAGLLTENVDLQSIVLVGDTPNSVYDGLVSGNRITQAGGLERRVRDQGRSAMGARVGEPYGSIEQTMSPAGNGRTVLVVRAPDRASLPEVARTLQDEGKLYAMRGNASLLGPDGSVRSLETAPQERVGVIPWQSRLKVFVRGAWFLLGVGVLLSAALLAFLVRAWASLRGGQAG